MSTSGQPSVSDAYTTPGNPASQVPTEQFQAEKAKKDTSGNNQSPTAVRGPPDPNEEDNQEATGPALMQGNRDGPIAGEEAHGATEEDTGRYRELDAEQMAAPGEGAVADAVKRDR